MDILERFDNDPSRPKIGEVVEHGGRKLKIQKVGAIAASELVSMLLNDREPGLEGHDDLLFRDHPIRPFVKWACWVDRV
jgi:hypothetical protein